MAPTGIASKQLEGRSIAPRFHRSTSGQAAPCPLWANRKPSSRLLVPNFSACLLPNLSGCAAGYYQIGDLRTF
jgi:hypothetical protein